MQRLTSIHRLYQHASRIPRSSVCRRRRSPSAPWTGCNLRCYSPSTIALEDAEAQPVVEDSESVPFIDASQYRFDKKKIQELSEEYNRRRDEYRKQVSKLRVEYMAEVKEHKAADEAERTANVKHLLRRKLERQRLKNIRSAQNAMRQLQIKEERERAFEEHLKKEAIKRQRKKDIHRKARQLLIDELEQEAPMWMCSTEEVEKAFSAEIDQALWARPGSLIGAPLPTEDAAFWQYESHTWHLQNTYLLREQHLFNELKEEAFEEANIDPTYWTEERLAEHEALEEKARLRQMVRDEGKRSLLLKQRQLLQDQVGQDADSEIVSSRPVPSLSILANIKAQEEEGAKILLRDPTKFFTFENIDDLTGMIIDQQENADDEEANAPAQVEDEAYDGPTLGAPTGLRDPLRTGTSQGRVWPLILAKRDKPDNRSMKEKKKEARERAMLEAAEAEAAKERGEDVVDVDAEFKGEDLNLDDAVAYDSDVEEWEKGLDPNDPEDRKIIETPIERRYRKEEIEWIIDELEAERGEIKEQLSFMIANAKIEVASRETMDALDSPETTTDTYQSTDMDYAVTEGNQTFMLEELGVDRARGDAIRDALTETQLLQLHELDIKGELAHDNWDLWREKLATVDGLTEEQIDEIVKFEQDISGHHKVLQAKEALVADATGPNADNKAEELTDVPTGPNSSIEDDDAANEAEVPESEEASDASESDDKKE